MSQLKLVGEPTMYSKEESEEESGSGESDEESGDFDEDLVNQKRNLDQTGNLDWMN